MHTLVGTPKWIVNQIKIYVGLCLKISLNSGLTIIMWATSKCDLFHNLPSTLWTFLSPKPLTFPETFLPELNPESWSEYVLESGNLTVSIGSFPNLPENLPGTPPESVPETLYTGWDPVQKSWLTKYSNIFNVPALLSLPWLALAEMMIESTVYHTHLVDSGLWLCWIGSWGTREQLWLLAELAFQLLVDVRFVFAIHSLSQVSRQDV